ncbi:PAS domain S-box protein [Ideonella azotifigens]|uniref:histidine kinase n=1 Tax=Ideonella azotifigens TaxID=513160 RepID=A0ABN1JWU3_9BURK|nr:PAS domain S-box protein [Ideonella azotifigens]MCD2341215.1 PAS domain S-box protein [Ideonella azotifigens]
MQEPDAYAASSADAVVTVPSELEVLRAKVAEHERAPRGGGLVDLLRHDELQFRRVVEEMSEGLMVFDVEGNVVFQNRASLRLHGFDETERGEMGRAALPVLWEGWDPSARRLEIGDWPASRVLRGEQVQDQVLRAVRRDTGKEFWASYNGSALHDAEGKVNASFITIRNISPQVRATEALRISKERLGQLFHSEMIGLFYWELEGGITDANDKFLRMVGYTRGELLAGKLSWSALTPPEYGLRDQAALRQLNAEGVGTPYEKEFIHKDGTRIPILIGSASRDGELREGTAFVLDISDRKQAEAETQRLAAIVESSNDAIVSKALDGRIASWNRAAQTIFGYSAEEAIGQPVQMLIPTHRQDEEMRILAELALGKSVPAFDTVRLRQNGEQIDVSVTISPIKDAAGRVIGASKIARDVSRQRRAEAALRDSEARLRFTLDAARVGAWNLDLATGAMQHSTRHDQCFGYGEQQPDWHLDTFFQHVHPEDRAEVEQSLQVAITELRDWRVQCRVVWPDGSLHWISQHGSVQREGGRATHMPGIVIDITEQREAERARLEVQRLEAENRQIQEATRLKSQFLANMSHELRTPLNAVIGFAELMQSGFVKPDSPKHQEFLGHIANSGRNLLQLINDVLDLSKVESGKFEFFPEPLDLASILKEAQAVLHSATSRKDIVISMAIDAGLTDLRLDPARLKQVLYNYLSNAIKFSASGGHVVVRVMAEGAEHFRVEVEDSGIGISPADLPRLFTEFQQLDAGYSKQHQGTGLGLALTRRLVEAQGGQVGVRSTVGVGSVFHVVLNRVHGQDTQRAEAAARRVQEREAGRVLVIEDDQRDQALLVDALSQAGFEVDAAADGPYALRRARETAYAALTLDLSLPGMRGLELLGDIRSRGASQASPVVGVTMPADLAMSATFAIANVLCKPIRGDEITSAMMRFRLPAPGRANVMVIDDDTASLDLMCATLKSIGIDAVCFQDGRQAMQEIDHCRPDAILLDLMMPEFDGFQVLDALQRMPAWREVPVFIWTSMMLTDDEYAILARSARAILVKGGGAMAAVLESVRRWGQPAATHAG